MTHEKIFRRDDGSRVKIIVRLQSACYGANLEWRWHVMQCEKGKRTWTSVVNRERYSWKRFHATDRANEERRLSLFVVSEQEVLQTMRELHAKIEPVQV